MRRTLSSLNSPHNPDCGHTLIELLVVIFITGVVLAMLTSLMQTSVTVKEQGSLETEAQQGLRGLLSVMTQELRQAGACLSTTGPMIALSGIDNSDQDTLTLRIGKVSSSTLQCAVAAANAAVSGATIITVDDASKFRAGDRVYIESAGTGQYNAVASVDSGGNTLTLVNALSAALLASAGVYAIEERTYALATVSGRPVLMMAVDGGTQWPLVEGVETFDVIYYLGPCSLNTNGTLNCVGGAVSAPAAGAAQWNQVKAVGVRAIVSGHKADKHGVIPRATTDLAGAVNGYVMVKPRNFL